LLRGAIDASRTTACKAASARDIVGVMGLEDSLAPGNQLRLEVVHSVIAAGSIAQAIQKRYPIGKVANCQLLRRGFNDMYEVQALDGRRYAARLSALRRRGPANVEYEVFLLRHIQSRGGGVAAPVLTDSNSPCIFLSAPEGRRALVLFDFLEGDVPDSAQDMGVTGAGLARLHLAAEDYVGPESRYRLDVEHLLHTPLAWLLATPTANDSLREQFSLLAAVLVKRLADTQGLSEVACHGDCHGFNNFMQRPKDGPPTTRFFDFDDGGPGFLAYDLAVLPWSLLLRKALAEPDAEALEKWQHFLAGYKSQRAVNDADAAAIPLFISMRHFWLMGEYASRAHHWGSQAMLTSWLTKQVDLLRAWQNLHTPPC
jgi:Ser/Thr protein kinase RdoA (MazF antagonist)